MSATSRLLSTIHFMGHTIFPDYPRDPFLANNWCVCKCVMWRLSETEHSTAYEGTLHIYSDNRNGHTESIVVILYLYVYTGTALGAASPSLSNGTSFQVCCLHLCPGTRAPLGRGDGRAASLRKDDLTQMSAAPPHLNIKTKYSFLKNSCLLVCCCCALNMTKKNHATGLRNYRLINWI